VRVRIENHASTSENLDSDIDKKRMGSLL